MAHYYEMQLKKDEQGAKKAEENEKANGDVNVVVNAEANVGTA